jgi:cob(I)alamin adenosyltransferase
MGVTMPKYTRIYTRTGDDGTTGLIGGERIKKSALRIEAYGTVDELSSAIGVGRASLSASLSIAGAAQLDAWLAWTQDKLFNLGCELATPHKESDAAPAIRAADVAALERAIDAAQSQLPALSNFIHPGGSIPGAQLHLARTICRRAERLVVALADQDDTTPADGVRFLNRLSDALFTWSRLINQTLSVPEYLWNLSATPPK